MALDNDELPKASDKTTDKLSVASGVTTKSTTIDEKPPKPIKEKTNLEELDEVELETLLKETLTYKSPRDRDCRSSLFNKLLVSAEDSIRKDSALNASGSEAVRHRNPQATSRSRYQQRVGNSTFSSGHQAGKHGTGGVGGTERKGGRNCCTGAGGGSGGGSIADKGTLGGSLNNLTVEDLYESISQHLQQRPEKSVSARQRTGGSLPCNVNAGLITPCETSELKSPTTTSPIIQQNCSAATITTVTTTASISPTVTTTTYCLTTSSCSSSSSSTIYGLSSNNTSVDLASDAVVLLQNPNTSHGTISSVSSCNSGDNSATTGKDSCVIEVEQDCTTGASGTDGTTSAGDMIGIKQPQSTTQSKPPLPSTAPPNNATTPFHSTNTNCSSQNTVAATIITATNSPLLGDGALNNTPHIDDDNDDYIVEEDDQHRRFQRQLNYATNDEERIDGTGRRLQQTLGGCEASLMSNATERASLSTADYYFLTFREEPDDKKQSDRDDVERRPLLLNMEGDEGAVGMAGSRVPSTGGGPMKIVGQGPQIKPNTSNSLHKQLLNSSIQHNATVTMPSQQTSPTPSPPNKRRSLNDINLNDLLKSPAPQHQSHHHSAQQPHHQHTGAVRISSLSSSNMLNLNHRRLLQQQQQQQQQHFDNGETMDLMDEVVIGVPSTLTGTMGGGSGDGAGRAVGSFLSERTIHVGDVVESPASTRQSDQDAPTTCDVSKGYGILPNKKIDDNGNHVTKSRKKVKPPEAVVRAEEVEGHRGDIAFDINKLVAFINGNEDTVASGNVAKSAKTTKSSVKLQQQQQQQQHRGSVSGTGNNNRAGGKSVDAEHHSRRHQNHHHNQQNQQNSAQSSAATKYERQLHRANSLEEMPTTTLEEFHANESQNKSGSSKGGKQVNNQQNKVSQAAQQSSTEPNVINKKASVNDGANVNNAAVVSSGESSVAVVGGGSSTNRGRGVLRVTKSGGSRSGGSAHRGSITRSGVNNSTSAGGVAVSAGESGGNLMQPRRSWTNADPSPLQAIQHGATTASAENLETDFTLVNSKKKKGKKQQQRRNSVGSRTPIITQPQTITSPPTNNRNNNHRYNNNHTNNSTTSDNHAPSGGGDQQQQQQQQRLITVNVATSATGNSQSEDCSSSDGDNTAAHLLVAIDGGAPFVGSNQSTIISSPANLTSYASITKSNVATQQPTIHIPPQPQTANSNVNTPKWPIATTNTNTTTTITATTLTTIPNNGCVATNSNNTTTTTTTTATVVHPETVVVAVQLKVVTNRSQEQQTDDIVPTLVDANGGGDYVVAKQQQIGGGGGFERQQQIGGHPTTEPDTKQHHQISTEPPSLNDMQRWPSINNNNNTSNNKSALHTNHIIEPPSDHQQDTSKSGNSSHIDNHQNVATWPTLGNPKHLKSTNVPIVSAADIASKDDVKIVTSDRVVVRSNNNNKAMGVRGARDDRIIVKDVDARNKMNSARHGGDKHNLGAVHRPVEMQSYVVQHHNVIHPVLVTQHIHHPQHIAPQVISLIPITKLPPPNLIDHTTPPPPNFIQPQQQQQHHHLNQHYQSYAQAPQHIIVQNNVLYTPIHLPANIPDVQMIEHQMQLQHNNNVHTKNTYNQNSAADGKGNSKSMDYQQKYHNDQQSVYQEQLPPAAAVDYQLQVTRRPPVVIMRDLSINSPMGDGGRVVAATADDDDNDDDMSCCELTFGFDVNEELLSLHDENYSNVSECQSQGVDGETTVDDGCTLKDVSAMFARRFVAPDIQAEFNYEKIVDYVANAWHETIADSSDGKCNFYQDL